VNLAFEKHILTYSNWYAFILIANWLSESAWWLLFLEWMPWFSNSSFIDSEFDWCENACPKFWILETTTWANDSLYLSLTFFEAPEHLNARFSCFWLHFRTWTVNAHHSAIISRWKMISNVTPWIRHGY
jgi:hypothetical protein